MKTPLSTSTNYSTVTDFSPTGSVFLVINILFKSPNLWVSPYSQYQQRLFNIIRSQHEEQGKNFVEICNYLISKNILPIVIGSNMDKESIDLINKYENNILNLKKPMQLSIGFFIIEFLRCGSLFCLILF